MIVLAEYFPFANTARRAEVLQSIKDNCNVECIERVILFAEEIPESDREILSSFEKIQFVDTTSRSRYSDIFSYANKNLRGEVCVVCNNDISFTDNLQEATNIDDDMFLCLTRWDMQEDGTLQLKEPKLSRKHSQDAWIFKSPLPQKMVDKGGLFFGRPGCDNMIAYLGVISGLKVLNPSELIISKHRHLSNSRNYEQNKRGTPAKDEKVGHHSLYMNVGASNTIEYATQNLVYKLQQAWRPKDRVFNGEQAVTKAIELEDELEPIWRQSTDQFRN
jgi:hypothetical protein